MTITFKGRKASSLSFIFIVTLFSYCARPFQPLALETRSYTQTASAEGLIVSYDTFAILEVSNNRRYVKKVRKQDLKFLPIRLTNTTTDTVVVDRTNLQTFGEYEVIATPSLNKLPRIRQVSWPYLLFILGDFSLRSREDNVELRITYFPIGTAWGVSNFVVARKANRRFQQAMQHYVSFPIGVPPGQIRYALLPVAASAPTNQLQIRYVAQE